MMEKFHPEITPDENVGNVIAMSNGKKTVTVRMDSDLHKKLKIKATAKDVSLNEYITSLISADVDAVDLSGIVGK